MKAVVRQHHTKQNEGINKLEFADKVAFGSSIHWDNKFCDECVPCGSFKTPTLCFRTLLTSLTAWYPNEMTGVDTVVPIQDTLMNRRYTLLLVDCLTKWCEAIHLKQTWTVQSTMHPDNYKQSEARNAKTFYWESLIKYWECITMTYHPRVKKTNGVIQYLQ